ncbi:hypothetical protein NLI96_g7407 [Meripilus lineatus]|uniref:Vps53 N-terminal domain-containing protein n=1 Tax=Meripilus lineatus TaxID=2056292 RepID=A0AAD5UZI9_9APHY|nr:hypothetical protein NLI96_g7407 [Physisporinus lineatus]
MSTDIKRPFTAVLGVREDVLPQEVVLSIQRILESKSASESDPLDMFSSEFDPVEILNSYFPDESALSQLDAVQARLTQTEQDLQKQIDELQLELSRDQDPNRMQLIQEMISVGLHRFTPQQIIVGFTADSPQYKDLLGQISRIREKATESEAVVRNITKEIQVLDVAKKNLIHCMTTFKRLQMLVNALGQLEGQVGEKNYLDIAQTLAAVKQISASFKSFNTVHRIAQISRRIQEVQAEVRTKIDSDWEKFYAQDPTRPIKPSAMAAACKVVDVLGPEVRMQFVERYVALELKEYRRIFRATDEAGQLDNLSRRFAWMRRLLQTHENEVGRVFPAEWRAGWHLCAKFAEITRDDMTVLLSRAGSKLTVKQLLSTLEETMEFENSLGKKYATPFDQILKATQQTNAARPSRSISSAFEPHMGVFIDAQDKALSDMLSQYRGPKSRTSLEAAGSTTDETISTPVLVLPSSTELFYFYAQSLDQCASLFTGQPLFELCALHKKWLRIYAEEVLVASMKKPTAIQPRKSVESRYDPNQVKSACTLVNTADYCHTTALEVTQRSGIHPIGLTNYSQLEEKIREKVADDFKPRVSFQEECDQFVSVISSAIQTLVREFEAACEAAFLNMQRTAWATLSLVSGQSSYVDELTLAIEQLFELIKPRIEQKKYLRNFLDKASGAILGRFTSALVKSRPLKEIGAEQLLIDLQAVKACLLKLPGESLTTSNYTRSITKTTTRLEALLKVIVTPVDPTEGFILNYTLLIGDDSSLNFQKILDLKGTPKTEQNDLLDSFLAITSTKPELENTSFLSSLDMDPGQAVGLGSPGPIATSGSDTPPKIDHTSKFTDFRRFVSFAVRRDSMPPS